MIALERIVKFLDRELAAPGLMDSSNNGLQVASSGQVRKVCCGVDGSVEFFEAARKRGGDFLVVHHGISWGDSLKRITQLNYKTLSYLVRHDMALYASHLPLDAHPKYGNNIGICRALGLRRLKPFGMHGGRPISFHGQLPRPMSRDAFKALVRRITGNDVQSMDFGRKTIRTVGVVSGGAQGDIGEAARLGLDVFVSGEPGLNGYNLARDWGMNALFAGHYATEGFGPRAIGALLRRKFGLPYEFIDLKVRY